MTITMSAVPGVSLSKPVRVTPELSGAEQVIESGANTELKTFGAGV
jgi:hypothetical protein